MEKDWQDYVVFFAITIGSLVFISGFTLAMTGYKELFGIDLLALSMFGLFTATMTPMILAVYNGTIGK